MYWILRDDAGNNGISVDMRTTAEAAALSTILSGITGDTKERLGADLKAMRVNNN